MRPREWRVPFDRLERLVAVRLGVPAAPGGWHGWTNDDMAAVLGCSVTALKQMRARRVLSLDQADRLAIAAGWHPAEVWPEWWELVAEADRERSERSEAERLRRRARDRERRAKVAS